MSLWEKLLIPAAGTLIFFLLSGGFMLVVGGATSRMRAVLWCAILFAACMVYSMAWHAELAHIFNWEHAWIATTIAAGILAILLGNHMIERADERGDP